MFISYLLTILELSISVAYFSIGSLVYFKSVFEFYIDNENFVIFVANFHLFDLFLFFKIYLFLAVLGLHCCVRAFSSCSDQGLLFVAVRGLLLAVASPVEEHGL